jgi:hypothetical protein
MDPYLEGTEWTSVHSNLIEEMARQLAPQLLPKYVVRSVRRFMMDMPMDLSIMPRAAVPDIGILSTREPAPVYAGEAVTMPPPLQIPTVIPEKVPITSLEIRDVVERELVTSIELLSPANKRGEGYREYIRKRARILQSRTHLLEIDLLRQGRRVPMRRPLPEAAYFVFLSRVEKRPITDVWPIQLDEPLPTIPVPLLPEDDDATVNLQAALATIYDTFGYGYLVNYTWPPEIPLVGETAVWADQLLQQAGFR